MVDRLRLLRARGDVAATSPINVDEVVRGLRPSEQILAQRLLDGLLVVPLDRTGGEQAGAWRRDYARRGVTLSQPDCLVAAAALSTGGLLATGNPRDFPMPEIDLQHWPVGV